MSVMNSVTRSFRSGRRRRMPGPVLEYEKGVPVVPVIAKRYRGQWSLHLAACPYCGKPHVHGGGNVHENPHDNAGHRGSHCLESEPGDVGYVLRIVDPMPASVEKASEA